MTGAGGFVGSAVTRALLARGARVRALVRAGADTRNLEDLDVDLATGDLGDAPSLSRATEGCEAVFHVAADYRLWTPDPRPLYRSNVEGTRHVFEAARAAGVSRVIHTSSVATLGLRADGTPSDETDLASLRDMIGHYKRSKFLSEQLAREAALSGLPVVIVNPSTPVGPRDLKPTPTGRIVLDAWLGRTPAYVDTGLNIVHVDDVATGHLLAFEHGRIGERYVLGGDDLMLREILAIIAALAGRPAPRVRLPIALVLPIAYLSEAFARLSGGDTRVTVEALRMARHRMFFSSAKAQRELGYHWRPAREALEDAVRWLQSEALKKQHEAPRSD